MSEKLDKSGLQHAWSRIKNYIDTLLGTKQDTLVSGTNIKTVNNNSLLGSGNIEITGGASNWADGSQTGSVRTVRSVKESESYTIGANAVAEGLETKASGYSAHAEGYNAIASSSYTHAQNEGTIAAKSAQTALGRYNIEDTTSGGYGKYAVIVGNGIGNSARSNALTVDWEGNIRIAFNPDAAVGTVDGDLSAAMRDDWKTYVID